MTSDLPPIFVENRLVVQLFKLVENRTTNTALETNAVIAARVAGALHD
jgi:hypothetical protein